LKKLGTYDCHQNFLIAFSCKGEGICPSCKHALWSKRSASSGEFNPCIPVRQWVISFPKRIRHYLHTDVILQEVLHTVVNQVRKKLIDRTYEIAVFLSMRKSTACRTIYLYFIQKIP